MKLRFAIPVVKGRGAGLANELFSWAKAYIAAQELGLTPLHPGWGFNKRPYWKYFGTWRGDRLVHEALRRTLPTLEFTEEEYIKRRPASFRQAIRAFGEEHDIAKRTAVVVEVSGLWGGIPAVHEATDFIRGQLLTARHSAENLYKHQKILDRQKGVVCFHIRRGDFASSTPAQDYSGKFNIAVPIDWFVSVARELRQGTGDQYQFVVVGDCTDDDIRDFVVEFPDLIVVRRANSDISDLLLLSQADVIVCSVSSYSMWGVCLSSPSSRYIWFEPNLVPTDGRYTIWGHLPHQALPHSETQARIAEQKTLPMTQPRGIAAGRSGRLAREFIDHMNAVASYRAARTDLLQYGSVAPTGSDD